MNKTAKIFKDAARRIENGDNRFCCVAIHDAGGRNNEIVQFAHLFSHKPHGYDVWWPMGDSTSRIIALTLAAMIAKEQP